MLESLRRVLHEVDRDRVGYECRRCGTGVDWSGASCPACDSRDIARYEL